VISQLYAVGKIQSRVNRREAKLRLTQKWVSRSQNDDMPQVYSHFTEITNSQIITFDIFKSISYKCNIYVKFENDVRFVSCCILVHLRKGV